MYSRDILDSIIKSNRLLTKIINRGKYNTIILVPNFCEYNILFGNGKTRTCYAYDNAQWNYYHGENSVEVCFLSVSDCVPKELRYVTFCVNVKEIKESNFRKGGNGSVSGWVMIHDLDHYIYTPISFKGSFCESAVGHKLFVDVDWYFRARFGSVYDITKLHNLEKKTRQNIIDTIIKGGVQEIIEKWLDTNIKRKTV